MKTSVHDYVGLIFCDTRRAQGWRKALAQRGIEARVLETFGEESENGAYKVSVPRKQITGAYGVELVYSSELEGSDGAIVLEPLSGDARYLRTHAEPAVNAAALAKVNADAALHKATTEEREAAEFLAAHANDWANLCDAE